MIEIPDIYDRFEKLVAQIPEGFVTTYGDIAVALGDIIASRAVGEMLSENNDPIKVPCHRVVRNDGSVGGFTHPLGVSEKIRRLRSEGIKINNGKVQDFQNVRFRDFRTDYPLIKFRNFLKGIENDENLINEIEPRGFNIIDVSYEGRTGIGAAFDLEERTVEFSIKRAKSPYIPNYLFLREGEIIMDLIRHDKFNIIDGNGMIHRDKRGLATVSGFLKNSVTIGSAKKLLTGTVFKNTILVDGEPVGMISGRSYLSIGYGFNFEGLQLLERVIRDNIKYDPITKIPDRFSRRYRDEVLFNQNRL